MVRRVRLVRFTPLFSSSRTSSIACCSLVLFTAHVHRNYILIFHLPPLLRLSTKRHFLFFFWMVCLIFNPKKAGKKEIEWKRMENKFLASTKHPDLQRKQFILSPMRISVAIQSDPSFLSSSSSLSSLSSSSSFKSSLDIHECDTTGAHE